MLPEGNSSLYMTFLFYSSYLVSNRRTLFNCEFFIPLVLYGGNMPHKQNGYMDNTPVNKHNVNFKTPIANIKTMFFIFR